MKKENKGAMELSFAEQARYDIRKGLKSGTTAQCFAPLAFASIFLPLFINNKIGIDLWDSAWYIAVPEMAWGVGSAVIALFLAVGAGEKNADDNELGAFQHVMKMQYGIEWDDNGMLKPEFKDLYNGKKFLFAKMKAKIRAEKRVHGFNKTYKKFSGLIPTFLRKQVHSFGVKRLEKDIVNNDLSGCGIYYKDEDRLALKEADQIKNEDQRTQIVRNLIDIFDEKENRHKQEMARMYTSKLVNVA